MELTNLTVCHSLEVRSRNASAKIYKLVFINDGAALLKFVKFQPNQMPHIMREKPIICECISEHEYNQLSAKCAPIAIKCGGFIRYVENVNAFAISFLNRESIKYVNVTETDILINSIYVPNIDGLNGSIGVQLSKTVLGVDLRRYVQRDDKQFDAFINAGWSIHEIINGKKPSRFILDIDLPREDNGYLERTLTEREFIKDARDEFAENGTEFIDYVKATASFVLSRYCADASACDDYLEYGYETENKISRHIIYPGVICENGKTNKAIIKEIAAELVSTINTCFEVMREENGPSGEECEGNEAYLTRAISSILDPVGCAGYWHMRFPGCSKNGDFSRTIKPLNARCSKYGLFMGVGAKFENPNTAHPDGEISQPATASEGEESRAMKAVNKYYPGTFKLAEGGRLIKCGTFACPLCGSEHKSSGAFISWYRGKFKIICFRHVQKTKSFICIVRAHPQYAGELEHVKINGLEVTSEQKPDEFNTISGAIEVIGERCTEAIADDFNSSYIISSVWGTGKSYFIARAIEDAKAKGLKVICISSRISLSFQQVNNWGLTNYSDIKGRLNSSKPEHAATNWQIEALAHRVDPQEFAGSLIVVDEITALAQHCASEDNDNGSVGYMRRMGLNILAHLLGNCARYIVSDNDINDVQIKALINANTAIKPLIYNNSYSKYEGATVNMYVHKSAHSIADNEIMRRIRENYKKYVAGYKVFPICVSHHLRKSVMTIADNFRSYADPQHFDLLAYYTRDTTQEKKQADYSDATTAWAGKIAVIYSPTISIGISAEIADITEVYGVFEASLISAQQSAQSLFRCRNARVFHIYMNYGVNPDHVSNLIYAEHAGKKTDKPAGLKIVKDEEEYIKSDRFPDTLPEYFEWVNRSKVPRDLGYNYMNYYNPFTSGSEAEKYLMGSFVGSLFVSAKIQMYRSKNNFYREFVAILKRAKFNVCIAEITVDIRDETGMFDKIDNAKDEYINVINSIMHAKKCISVKERNQRLFYALDNGITPQPGTQEYTLYNDLLFMFDYLKISPSDSAKLKHDDMLTLYNEFDKIKLVNRMLGCCRFNSLGLKTKSEQINTLTRSDAEIFPNIARIMEELGITDIAKFCEDKAEINIPIERMTKYVEDSDHITYFMENNRRLFGRATRAEDRGEYLKSLLEHVGVSCRLNGNGGSKARSDSYILSFLPKLKKIESLRKINVIRKYGVELAG